MLNKLKTLIRMNTSNFFKLLNDLQKQKQITLQKATELRKRAKSNRLQATSLSIFLLQQKQEQQRVNQRRNLILKRKKRARPRQCEEEDEKILLLKGGSRIKPNEQLMADEEKFEDNYSENSPLTPHQFSEDEDKNEGDVDKDEYNKNKIKDNSEHYFDTDESN